MTERASMNMTVLYEDEIRIAARAVALVRKLSNDPAIADTPACEQAWITAMHACLIALAGAEDDRAALVLTTKAAILGANGRTAADEKMRRETDTWADDRATP